MADDPGPGDSISDSTGGQEGEPAWTAERFAEVLRGEASPRRAEMRRLADATRRVIAHLVATEAPLDVLEEATRQMDAALSVLQGWPQGRLYEGFGESANAGDPYAFFDNSPMIGASNPLAPPIALEVRKGVVHGRARFGAAYEGPPGAVHGGYVAAAFDEVLGMAQSLSGSPGMTGTLTVRYRRPTPLHADLRFEATLDRQEGRKLFTSGRCFDEDGELTAEAEGLFITVDFTRLAALMEQRRKGPD